MNNNDRRVVVTGLGAITPIGNTVEETWQAMKTGKNGIDKITLFDTNVIKLRLLGPLTKKDHLVILIMGWPFFLAIILTVYAFSLYHIQMH